MRGHATTAADRRDPGRERSSEIRIGTIGLTIEIQRDVQITDQVVVHGEGAEQADAVVLAATDFARREPEQIDPDTSGRHAATSR